MNNNITNQMHNEMGDFGRDLEMEKFDPPFCLRCHKTMDIPFPLEPTKYCNLCAQELIIEMEVL